MARSAKLEKLTRSLRATFHLSPCSFFLFVFDDAAQVETSPATHFANVQGVNLFLNSKDGKTLRGPTDRTRWNTIPTIVNAFYEPEMNSISKFRLMISPDRDFP